MESFFDGCKNLRSIPADLFAYNTQVTNFDYCFKACQALTKIPDGLFANNTEATGFSGCFEGCLKLKLNEFIFCNNPATEKATRFAGKAMDFQECFRSAGANLESSEGSIAPDLWNYEKGTGTWTTTDCFSGAKISNAVPGDGSWGTPATP